MAAKKKTAKRRAKKPVRQQVAKASPKAKAPAKPKPAPTTANAPAKEVAPRPRDPRLPKPGAILRREHQGKVIEITVLEHGFKFDGRTWRSLSAIAREVTNTVWNGYLWLNLQSRAKAPATDGQKGGAQ
jgi:hypothetical protein